MGAAGDVLPEQVCFHAQQAVEEAFKAVLLHRKLEFPFTHDLAELLDTLADAGIDVPSMLSEADELTPYAVETRYPGLWGEITELDVEEAIRMAEKALVWARAEIG